MTKKTLDKTSPSDKTRVVPDLETGEKEYYYTTKELSGLLNLAISTLAGYRRAGVGPNYISLGYRTCRYARSEVLAYMNERARMSTSDQGSSKPSSTPFSR
jgi:hypothetical protein